MKSQSTTIVSIFSLLILFGCQKENLNPVASFSINRSVAEVGETVSFVNSSENSTEYIWDFGDGNASPEKNPTHIYQEVGTYTVELTTFGNESRALTTQTVEIIPATVNIEPGVRVGDFYLKDDLEAHFSKLDENRMNYSMITTSNAEYLHIFSFGYVGISFYLITPTEDYQLEDNPSQIHVYTPYSGWAKGRITLGSSFEEVTNVFGTPNDVFSSGDHFYDGIIFYADDSKLLVNRIAVL